MLPTKIKLEKLKKNLINSGIKIEKRMNKKRIYVLAISQKTIEPMISQIKAICLSNNFVYLETQNLYE
ncbi:unnamed protein product [Blepharisma stoltei]|uniref:Uncharacterized protein n=1 Tax=Blepharisma stoltei TaxID=1481888 RepID=A0AAU9JXY1_9CILI|nr:unnamed protein product [Blepharisma stoltei]